MYPYQDIRQLELSVKEFTELFLTACKIPLDARVRSEDLKNYEWLATKRFTRDSLKSPDMQRFLDWVQTIWKTPDYGTNRFLHHLVTDTPHRLVPVWEYMAMYALVAWRRTLISGRDCLSGNGSYAWYVKDFAFIPSDADLQALHSLLHRTNYRRLLQCHIPGLDLLTMLEEETKGFRRRASSVPGNIENTRRLW